MGDTTGLLLWLALMLWLLRWATGALAVADAGEAVDAFVVKDWWLPVPVRTAGGDMGPTRVGVVGRPPMTLRGIRSTPLVRANAARVNEACA
jgi:hypothetical protein